MSEEWQTRQTLLLRAKNQDDEAAWGEFVAYYQEFIHMILYKMNLPAAEVDDLAQDILIRIWKSLPTYIYDQDRAKFRTWLSRLIRNQVLDHFRSLNRRQRKHTALGEDVRSNDVVIDASGMEDIIEREWQLHIIQLALKNISSLFSGKAIGVFSMSIEGKSTDEIAQHFDIKPNSVVKLRNRVKERLMREVKYLRREMESL